MPAERRMTSAEIRRKTNKPIMEKKRRERINRCLDELKNIVLRAVNEESRPNKLEKADILEMTVRYLRTIKPVKQTADRSLFCQPVGNSGELRRRNTNKDQIHMNPTPTMVKEEHVRFPTQTMKSILHLDAASRHPMEYPANNRFHIVPPPIPSNVYAVYDKTPVPNYAGKYSPIPVSPISSVSSKSPCRDLPFEEQNVPPTNATLNVFRPDSYSCNPVQNSKSFASGNECESRVYSPSNLSNSSSTLTTNMSSTRSGDLWSPSNSHDSSLEFQSNSYQINEKNESFIWRPWVAALEECYV